MISGFVVAVVGAGLGRLRGQPDEQDGVSGEAESARMIAWRLQRPLRPGWRLLHGVGDEDDQREREERGQGDGIGDCQVRHAGPG